MTLNIPEYQTKIKPELVNRRFVGFDPGGSTGWAILDVVLNADGTVREHAWTCGVFGPGAHHLDLWNFICESDISFIDGAKTHLVYESFEYRNVDKDKNKIVLDSVEYIGLIKLYHEISGPYRVTITKQMAAEGKVENGNGFVKRINLVKLGLWKTGRDELGREYKHAMDAYGHILYNVLFGLVGLPDLRMELLEKGWRHD